ncbi:MAG TPA: SRPBCC domain-containing protein [Micropepsaceae bacterium]|nr:SRPBCC domain-containing protein [Micropepsaceae bacterium]
MASAKPPDIESDLVLVITKTFDAPRERVFDAWLDPDSIALWIGTRDIRAETLELTPHVGGRYRIHMRRTDGSSGPIVSGTYREIARPERLIFTWTWESGHPVAAGQDTLVTVTFAERSGRTEMTLKHEVFSSKDVRDRHKEGWTVSFEKMAERLAQA